MEPITSELLAAAGTGAAAAGGLYGMARALQNLLRSRHERRNEVALEHAYLAKEVAETRRELAELRQWRDERMLAYQQARSTREAIKTVAAELETPASAPDPGANVVVPAELQAFMDSQSQLLNNFMTQFGASVKTLMEDREKVQALWDRHERGLQEIGQAVSEVVSRLIEGEEKVLGMEAFMERLGANGQPAPGVSALREMELHGALLRNPTALPAPAVPRLSGPPPARPLSVVDPWEAGVLPGGIAAGA